MFKINAWLMTWIIDGNPKIIAYLPAFYENILITKTIV